MNSVRALRDFLAAHPLAALVEVAEAKGSTPREQGAWMLVAPDAIFGTVGGGQLEFLAIAEARRVLGTGLDGTAHAPPMLASATGNNAPSTTRSAWSPSPASQGRINSRRRRSFPIHGGGGPREAWWRGPLDTAAGATTLDIPLGPEIGQCCGGRVSLRVVPVEAAIRSQLLAQAGREDAARPHVLLFGAGHVGHALALALAPLPVHALVVETRAEALAGLPDAVEARLSAVPEQAVREAVPHSAFVILTHDHALDFLLAAEALKRGDGSYVGMIGSKTKRNAFRRWFLGEAAGKAEQFAQLVCPIGGAAVHDKRPAVIAALTAAEILTALATTRPFSLHASMP